MSEITRTEKFLRACIDGEPCKLKPLTRMEKLLAELNETLAGGPSEVVILPETELTYIEEQGSYVGNAQSPLEEGKTYIVTYNGTAYDCLCAAQEIDPGAFWMILGNSDALDIGVSGGNPNAPFAVICAQDTEDILVMAVPLDGATTVTLSIVQVGAASGGSAGGVVTATAVTGDGPSVTSIDKTYSELLSAVKAGKYVQMMAKIGTAIIAVPFVFWMEEGDSGYMLFSVQAKAIAATIQYNADGTAEWAQ